MVWLFMIPSIPGGVRELPAAAHDRRADVAFPRLNLSCFYLYVGGRGAGDRAAMIVGGADTGWTFYAPYSARPPTAVAPVVLGVFVLGCRRSSPASTSS